jgi:lysophospholipid acyltransferase (LPLAT)-like uncharacterized protein
MASFKEAKQGLLHLSGNVFLSPGITALCKTVSITFKNNEAVQKLESDNQNYIVAFWHNTMIIPWYVHRKKNFTALISKSKDGNLLAKLLRSWKYNVVRGSSSRGGDVALGIMVDYAKNKYSIAITPDGPRGPKYKMKAGAVITAKKSGVPLVLVGVGIKQKKVLDSWDKFEIPKPFTKINVIYSEPFYFDKHLSFEDTSAKIAECEKILMKLQSEASDF